MTNSTDHTMGHEGGHDMSSMDHGAIKGVSLSDDGLMLSAVTAPAGVGETGELSFRVLSEDGSPVTRFAAVHDKAMHLIVVRADGSDFRHVHPTLDPATGTWSTPWTWREGGVYRLYADFATEAGAATTLGSTVHVAGNYVPATPRPSRVSEVDGFTVTLAGDLSAEDGGILTLSVDEGGEPVNRMEPYLAAFGHLVALREGDLAFLHVHPEGAEPGAGDLGGPAITFATHVPTPGRYLLFLDFQVDGKVRTASFVLDAGRAATEADPARYAAASA